ncbi:MAG: hypothetical protein JJ855_06030 [Rhodospirillales bacterium]|nr:hypothetical protein [Rhodospirillales bacterium]
MGVVRVARIAAPLLSVVLLHILIVFDQLVFAPAALASGLALSVVLGAIDGTFGGGGIVAGLLILAFMLGLQGLALYVDAELAMAVTLLPILIHLWLAWIFGRTLVKGREPLIRRFSRIARGDIPDELESYTRRLTVIWTVAMLALALVATVSALIFPPKTWSWVANLGLPLFSVALFLGEHAYRSVRFRHLGHNSPLTTLKTLSRPHLWMSP